LFGPDPEAVAMTQTTKSGLIAVGIVGALALLFSSVLLIGGPYFWNRHSVVGVWKATGQDGSEHYIEFYEDGSLTWWDRERDPSRGDGFNKKGPFKGSYRWKGRMVFITQDPAAGFIGELMLVSDGELEATGEHAMRAGLVFRRVAVE
jgi:hypothetical protein